MSDSFVVSGTLFNKEYEVTIQKEWGVMVLRDSRIVRQFSETIGKINSLDIINIINLEDEYKNYMFINVSSITLSEDQSYDDDLDIVKSEWNYYIKYGYTSGIGMGGSELKLTKREFEQKLREIKLNNLLK
jgi:hypothetical protein